MEFAKLNEAEAKLKAKQDALAAVFAEAGSNYDFDNVKSLTGNTEDKLAAVNEMNAELDTLGKDVERLRGVKAAAQRVADGRGASEAGVDNGAPAGGVKSFGKAFVESAAYKAKSGSQGPEARIDMDLKSLFSTGAGWEPETNRTGRVVPFATTPIQVADVIPQGSTSQAAVVYMEETTFTNAAAETAESTQATLGTYPEAALGLTEKSSPVRKIAVYLPMTDEQLEDVAGAESYVNNRLPFMLRQRLDSQILNGSGTAPNLEGLLNVTGVQTQALGTDARPDAFYKAMTNVRVTGQAVPNVVLIHPNDWQDIRLLRTADGLYIWGNPSESGPERLWGLPVVQAQAIPAGTGLVGDFANFVELSVRRGIDVQVSNSHADYFINGKQAVRADVRVALPVYRPAAFCKVTGL